MLRVAFVLLFGWAIGANLKAQSLEQAAAQLAGRISSQLPPRATVSLELQNLTTIAPANSSSFRSALEQELSKADLRITATQPDARIRVTLSENARGPLFVVELAAGENRRVIMLPWTAPPKQDIKPRLKITSRSIFEQAEPILDVLLFNSDSELLVLSPSKLASFRLTDGKWMAEGVAALNLARRPPRDPRGRVETASGVLHVYLPGSSCAGKLPPALQLTCAAENENWLLNPSDPNSAAHWVTDRNLLQSNIIAAGFYSSAYGWFRTGDSRMIDRDGDSLEGADPWGSDVTGINNTCGGGLTVLASDRGENPDRDQVQAYEIMNGRAVPSSEPLSLSGPVTALWPAQISGQATLVIQNSKTGNYEAFRLGLACGQ